MFKLTEKLGKGIDSEVSTLTLPVLKNWGASSRKYTGSSQRTRARHVVPRWAKIILQKNAEQTLKKTNKQKKMVIAIDVRFSILGHHPSFSSSSSLSPFLPPFPHASFISPSSSFLYI